MANDPRITPTADGPYRLEGVSHVTRIADGTTFPVDGQAFLCRCGGSATKPFCDGTHVTNGFNGDKDPDRVPDHRDDYVSADGRLTIHDNRGLCAHAGRCTDGLAAVFRLKTEPFVDPDGAAMEEITQTIGQCPSGALSYSIDGVEHRERNTETGVVFAPGGPYVLTRVHLDGAGELPEGATTDHCTLCRCGKSTNKPFCSGAHWYVDFDQDAAPNA